MKSSIWIALPLAAALMTPAMAQQTTDTQKNPPAATSNQNAATSGQNTANQNPTTADESKTTTYASGQQPLTPERHEGFWGKLNPMARKKYVQRQVQPIRDRVNELDELTAANSKMIKDVDSRAQEGIRMASAKATEADQHAVDAGNRAQMAHQTAQQASTRLNTVEQVVGNIDQYQPATQAEIRFSPGQMVLSKKAKAALDEMADPLKAQKGYIVEVQGFSSGKGQAAIENSQRMAQSVVRYLVLNHEIPVYRIFLLGMGNAPVPASTNGTRAKRTAGGRVEISVLKNNLDQLTTNASNVTPASEASPSYNTNTQGGVSGTTTAPAPSQPSAQPTQGNPNAQPSSNMNAQPNYSAPAATQPSSDYPQQQPQPSNPR